MRLPGAFFCEEVGRDGPPTQILLIIQNSVQLVIEYIHRVRQAGAGGWSWSCVREKYCYLAGGWRLELERCVKEIL